jgi:DNA-binding response OmpR family regulator
MTESAAPAFSSSKRVRASWATASVRGRLVYLVAALPFVMDFFKTGSGGHALCAGVRKQAALERLPILFMTVCHGDREFLESLKKDGNSCIRKPFTIPVLKSRIDAMLIRVPAASPRKRDDGIDGPCPQS